MKQKLKQSIIGLICLGAIGSAMANTVKLVNTSKPFKLVYQLQYQNNKDTKVVLSDKRQLSLGPQAVVQLAPKPNYPTAGLLLSSVGGHELSHVAQQKCLQVTNKAHPNARLTVNYQRRGEHHGTFSCKKSGGS